MELRRTKNVATYIVFPLVDADGDPVSGATGPDSEIDAWSDGAAPDGFADCTNEATEIGTTGMYYLSLTQTECNVDYAIVQVKSSAKTQVILINFTPQVANATQFAGQTITAAAGVTLPSTVASPTNITAGTITTVTNLTNAPTSGDLTATMKTSVTTAATAATPTAAAVTAKVTPIDVDGITFASAMEVLLAVLSGVTAVSGSDVEFMKRDGTTVKITITYGAGDGERDASVIS